MNIIESVPMHRIMRRRSEKKNGMERKRKKWALARGWAIQQPTTMAEARMVVRIW